MQTHHLKTARTARLLQHGSLSQETKLVWIAAHGYGMDIERFCQWFTELPEPHAVLCPEGLSRFYWGGFSGRPAASWMTSTERLSEIEDFCAWMDQVYAFAKTHAPNAQIVCLGFSQGAATIMRWLQASYKPVWKIVLWSGAPPEDIIYDARNFLAEKLISYWGDADELVTWETASQRFDDVGLPFQKRIFKGGHKIEATPLAALAQELAQKLSESDHL